MLLLDACVLSRFSLVSIRKVLVCLGAKIMRSRTDAEVIAYSTQVFVNIDQ